MNFKKLMWWRDNRPKEEKDALDKARELMELMAELHIPGQRIEEGFRTYEPEHVLLLEGPVFFSDARQLGVGMLSEDLEGELAREHITLCHMVDRPLHHGVNQEMIFPVFSKIGLGRVHCMRGDARLLLEASILLLDRAILYLRCRKAAQEQLDAEYDTQRDLVVRTFMEKFRG